LSTTVPTKVRSLQIVWHENHTKYKKLKSTQEHIQRNAENIIKLLQFVKLLSVFQSSSKIGFRFTIWLPPQFIDIYSYVLKMKMRKPFLHIKFITSCYKRFGKLFRNWKMARILDDCILLAGGKIVFKKLKNLIVCLYDFIPGLFELIKIIRIYSH